VNSYSFQVTTHRISLFYCHLRALFDIFSGRIGDEIVVSKTGDIRKEVEKLEKADRYDQALQGRLAGRTR